MKVINLVPSKYFYVTKQQSSITNPVPGGALLANNLYVWYPDVGMKFKLVVLHVPEAGGLVATHSADICTWTHPLSAQGDFLSTTTWTGHPSL